MRPAHARPLVLCVAFDGVAAHTEDAMLEAARAACAPFHLTVDSDDLALGLPIHVLLHTLASAQNTDIFPPEIERAKAIFERRYESSIRERGASLVDTRILELVKTFRAQIPQANVALVSSHIQDLTAAATALGITMSFDAIVGAPGKSGAGVYARAAAKFRVQAADCMGISRHPYDITCMHEIRMCAVGIRSNVRSGELLGSAGAWRVFISPQDTSVFALIDVFRSKPPVQRAADSHHAKPLIGEGGT